MPLYIGTSGWQYDSWRDVLYPADAPKSRWLERYAQTFPTVENNSAFYRLPKPETFATWRSRTPDGFVMAVKASRYLTHIKRLQDPAEPVSRFLGAASELNDRLGPVLLQLPPTLHAEPARLAECLERFPSNVRVAVEPRHDSWWTDEVQAVLADHDAALCWTDVLGRPRTRLWRSAGWGYLRFHEGAAQPWPRYGDRALRSWVRRLKDTWDAAADVYVYFNNDPGGAAVHDALRFAAIAAEQGVAMPGREADAGSGGELRWR
ncbi:MAG TPA: DUF72 domain-containing protein [Jiangellaceae bacterium]